MLMIYQYMKYREYQGEIDFLTGVMGRRLFLQHCQNIQSDQRIHGHQGWFLFLDVDWFKQINDKLESNLRHFYKNNLSHMEQSEELAEMSLP